MTPVTERTILLTGATGAIGASIARALAADGCRVLLHYARNVEVAEALAAEIGNGALALQADLSDPLGPTQLWGAAEAAAGRVHGLINNAGIRSEVRIEDSLALWQDTWRREFQVNFLAAVDLTRAAIRHFRSYGGGRIVNMASRAGQRGYSAEALPYGASKAALINLTKSVAQSFGSEGITAVAVSPGWVRTEMAEAFIAEHGIGAALTGIPIGAMAEPDEIGEIVTFALRPSQRSLNGAVLDVNGASYLR